MIDIWRYQSMSCEGEGSDLVVDEGGEDEAVVTEQFLSVGAGTSVWRYGGPWAAEVPATGPITCWWPAGGYPVDQIRILDCEWHFAKCDVKRSLKIGFGARV